MVRIQSVHHGWPFLNDSDPCMAMAMNSPLVALGYAEEPLEIEIVLNLSKLIAAGKETTAEGDHQPCHMLMKRIGSSLESMNQLLKFLSALLAIPGGRIKGRGNFLNFLHMLSDRLLLALHQFHTTVDAAGQTFQLLFCEPPFFASKFRWIDSRTSAKPSAIRRPGG